MPEKKRKLLIVANRFYPQLGGAEINVFLQAQELSKYFDVDVFTPQRHQDPWKETTHGIRIQRFPNIYQRDPSKPYLGAKTFCPKMFTKILFGGYDLIHCFPAANYNNALAVAAAKIKRIPIFLSNFDLYDYASILNQRGGHEILNLQDLPLGKVQKALLPRFDGIFTISERETSVIQHWNPQTELSTVPIQLEEFDQALDIESFRHQYSLPKGTPTLLCLSRVSHIKGQDILLKALVGLEEKVGDFRTLIVGRDDFEPSYAERLRRWVKDQGLQDKVIFTGGLTRGEALAAMAVADVHVLPMRFMNSGAVVIEAWASRKPVLQSSAIDPNYVVEGVNGHVFDAKDPLDLQEKITRLLTNPEHCRLMGESGRKLVEEKFLYPHLIQQYLYRYEEALALGGA